MSNMSGHSHWSGIKHKKAIEDAKKGKAFTRVARQIILAVQKGNSGDSEMNPTLRLALDKAREVNMPNENIKRAIDKGLGKGGGARLEEISYEGYGPFGVGIIVTVTTDNRNRTGAEIRTLFERSGGSIAAPGSVSYLQKIQPIPMISLEGDDMLKVEKLLDELDEHDDVMDVWSNLEQK